MTTHRTWVFSPLDLIAPIGLSLLAISLCVWGFIKAEEAPAKVVCLVTGAVFLAGIPAWYFVRSIKRKFDLLVGGIYIVYGKQNKPARHLLEAWIEDLINHWKGATWRSNGQARSLSEDEVRLAFEGVTVFFLDEEKLSLLGRFVRGYAWGRDCVVGFRPGASSYTGSLFKHEVSHQVLGRAGEPWDEKRHHAIFQITDLGA